MRRPVSGITVRDVNTLEPLFDFLLYGISMSRLCSIVMSNGKPMPEEFGGAIVKRALKRRGLNPDNFIATPFDAYRVRR